MPIKPCHVQKLQLTLSIDACLSAALTICIVFLFWLTAFCGHTIVLSTYRSSSLLLSEGLSVCYEHECLHHLAKVRPYIPLYCSVYIDIYPDSWSHACKDNKTLCEVHCFDCTFVLVYAYILKKEHL